MSTPGRQAAIEAAAEAMWETGREPNPLVRAWDRTENEAGKDETRRIVTAAIDAYERVLAEQPRESFPAPRDTDCTYGCCKAGDVGLSSEVAAEQPRGEVERLREALCKIANGNWKPRKHPRWTVADFARSALAASQEET